MTTAARKDVIAAMGPVDDVVVTKVIDMGATTEDLAEAAAWMANDEPFMNAGRPLAGGRVGQIIEIMAAIEEEEDDAA
jgi:hypothetical protein